MNTDLNKIVQQFRDERSMEMYGKNEIELTIAERQRLDEYIKDYNNPVWKDIIIDNINTGYKVNNIGQIKNQNGVFIKGSIGTNGYHHVVIKVPGYKYLRTLSVHRLVAQAFIPNPENKPQVNHINGIKTFNWIGNLEWNTREENMKHAVLNNLLVLPKGSESPSSIYTDEQIHLVCKLLESKSISKNDISELTGVSRSMIAKISSGFRWKHISSQYKIIPTKRPDFRSFEDKENVIKLLKDNLSTKEILTELKWPNYGRNRSFINYQRKRLLSTSSTIENTSKDGSE